jgi:ketopantoate reductase
VEWLKIDPGIFGLYDEYCHGAVVRLSSELNVATPINSFITAALKLHVMDHEL